MFDLNHTKLVTTNNLDPRITKLGELSAIPDPPWNAYTCTANYNTLHRRGFLAT